MSETEINSYKSEKFWVSPFNFPALSESKLNLPKSVQIHDVTLRDGEQTPGIVFNKQDKMAISRALSEAGVHRIEVGMPVISAEEKSAIKSITSEGLKAKIFTLARLIKGDIDESAQVGVDGIVLETPLGVPKRMQLGWSFEKALDLTLEMIDHAKSYGLFVSSFGVDTTRADMSEFLKFAEEVSKTKADSMTVVDTFGCISYEGMSYLMEKAKQVTKKPLEVHTHNDFGLAVAASFAAVTHGASTVHVAVNGIGERTGNASLDEIHMGLKYLYGIDTGIDSSKLVEISKLVESSSSFRVPTNKPFVGSRAFGRESGISVAGWAKYNLGSEPVLPELVGNKHEVVVGKKSGKGSIQYKLKELKLWKDSITEEQLESVMNKVKNKSQSEKKSVNDNDFIEIVKETIN
jgi:methanogen homocitrate synthase